ncbi:MAG: penicillin-binding protein activator [Micavibrio aeruginosavorus]|uniref:Penicillin-binding protein activator n=1 Tax=Micavibrio aeruginosavorus TaxID=349221 RepID=A0A2W5PYY1_9BACT|nr:MAG: penicillin-binding protein activator [Micavibrio aeruginosavorus]
MTNESIRSMTIFHRFCTVFSLFLLLFALGGCAGGKSPWDRTADQSATYGSESAPVISALPQGAAQSGTVKVAILLPLSGANANVGQSMLQAAQLAVFDMGYDNFELMPQDTQGTASGASAAAAAALQSGAQLILGPLFAEEVRAVKSVAGGRVNVIAFSTDWTLAGGNTYVMGFLPFGQVERIVDYAAAKGIKRAAVVSGADEYGTTVSRNFESEAADAGITISRALSDPAAYDAVFIPAGGQALTAALARVPNKSAQKLGTGLWDDNRIAAMPDMNGALFAAPSPSARAGFEQRYQSTYGSKPIRIASMAYDATALAETLAQSGLNAGRGPAYDAGSLTSANGFAGVDGIIRFNRSGLVERGMAVLSIQNGRIVEVDPAPASFRR